MSGAAGGTIGIESGNRMTFLCFGGTCVSTRVVLMVLKVAACPVERRLGGFLSAVSRQVCKRGISLTSGRDRHTNSAARGDQRGSVHD